MLLGATGVCSDPGCLNPSRRNDPISADHHPEILALQLQKNSSAILPPVGIT